MYVYMYKYNTYKRVLLQDDAMFGELISCDGGLLDLGGNAEAKSTQLSDLPQQGQQPITVVYTLSLPSVWAAPSAYHWSVN